jgi:integral membrane protein (TIGR01906 family)
VSTARAAAALPAHERGDVRSRWLGAVLPLTTGLVLLGLSLLILLLPVYMHAALDTADSAGLLGVSRSEAHALSDQMVGELLLGPGTFAFAGPDGRPFLGVDEAAHMRDVRLVLLGFLAVVALSAVSVGAALAANWRRAFVWRSVARGGIVLALGLLLVGVVALVAFDFVFELFHRLFFPGGNWAFDPASQRLVQLYPLAFWQLTSLALGVLAIGSGVLVWLVGRGRASRLEQSAAGEGSA